MELFAIGLAFELQLALPLYNLYLDEVLPPLLLLPSLLLSLGKQVMARDIDLELIALCLDINMELGNELLLCLPLLLVLLPLMVVLQPDQLKLGPDAACW